jgi:superfamily II DNA helicase RecQ
LHLGHAADVRQPHVEPPAAAKVPKPRAPALRIRGEPDSPLLSALKAWRLERSRAASLPAYVVFPDKTLVAIAERMPASEQELLAVPGVGPMKLATWGEDVLRIVAASAETSASGRSTR